MPGACREGDLHYNPSDCCGCPGCCHSVIGTPSTFSTDTIINGLGALRGSGRDVGSHCCCCGPNIWGTMECSTNVIVNGVGIVREGDSNWCCGGTGNMITGSGDVIVN